MPKSAAFALAAALTAVMALPAAAQDHSRTERVQFARGASSATLRLALSTAAGGMLGVDLLKRRGPPCTRTLLLDVARPAIRTRTREEDRSTQSGEERIAPAPRPAHLRAVRSTRHAPRISLARAVSSGVAAGSVRPASVA